MIRNLLISSLLLLLISFSSYGETYSITIVGGGEIETTSEDFYKSAIYAHQLNNTLKIKKKNSTILFGNPGRGKYGYYLSKKSSNKKVIEARNKFLKDGKCEDAVTIFKYMISGGEKKLIKHWFFRDLDDLDDNWKDDIKGRSSFSNAMDELHKIASKVKEGDRVIINISDHGFKLNENSWGITLGDSTWLTTSILGSYIDLMRKNKASINLNTFACYSGGFTKTFSDYKNSSNELCSVSSADPNVPGYGADALLPKTFDDFYFAAFNKYGNQLEAFACASGQDDINRPHSGLDMLVNRWIEANDKDCSNCQLGDKLTSINIDLDKVEKVVDAAPDRKLLIADFKNSYVEIMKKCSKTRGIGTQLFKKLKSCLDDKLAVRSINHFYRNAIKELISSTTGEPYNINMVQKHLNFLSNASKKDLKKYKTAYCCLSHNFKTGLRPKICRP